MIKALHAEVYRVYSQTSFEEVYYDLTRNEVIKLVKVHFRQRGWSINIDDDELVQYFIDNYWPEPLKEVDGVLINIYTGEPSMATYEVKGKKPKKVKSPLIVDTVED